MPARGREAIFVPEQDTEICPGVVGRRDEAAVHVSVTTRLETEHLPQPVHCRVGDRPGAPVGDAIARDRDRGFGDDAKGLAPGVIVDRVDGKFLHKISFPDR
jgi:hypothetical protein